MKNLFVYLSAIILITSCSSGDGIAPEIEPINTLESQIVGKTFWRVIEGSASDPYDYIPHFYGIEFNEDGNLYARYCADTIITTDEDFDRLGIDRILLSTYTINDSLIKFDLRDFNDTVVDPDHDDGLDWSVKIIDLNTNITYSEYQALLEYCDYIKLDPENHTILDLMLSAGIIEVDDESITLAWPFKLWDLFKIDMNSSKNFFNSFYYFESSWSSNPPNCSDYPIYQFETNCAECHISVFNNEGQELIFEIGEFCDEALEYVELDGYNLAEDFILGNDTLAAGFYEVHCIEHFDR